MVQTRSASISTAAAWWAMRSILLPRCISLSERGKGDSVLGAMVERQHRGVFRNGGGFQNGVVNAYPQRRGVLHLGREQVRLRRAPDL